MVLGWLRLHMLLGLDLKMMHKFIRQPIEQIILNNFRNRCKLCNSILSIHLLLNTLNFALEEFV
jgi:hypothetical protein